MTQDATASDTTIKITRQFNTTAAKLYEAWVTPEGMSQWMGPGKVTCKSVEIDLKVGGKYRIHMLEDGKDHIAIGEYQEIVPGQKLKFTWSWESGKVTGSIVTAEFKDVDGKAQLSLLHEKLPSKEITDDHNMGWNACLDNLGQSLS